MKTRLLLLRTPLILCVFFTLLTCTEPLTPEYQFKEGLIYIEGFLGTTEGSSYVKVSESKILTSYRNVFVSGAEVYFINAQTEERIQLVEEEFRYLPPPEFMGVIGSEWYIEVQLPNGKTYLSEVETINPSVPITELSENYDPNLKYIETYQDYVPGHEVFVTFDDPPEQDNYYFWSFKAYDKSSICRVCYEGRYREGECQPYDIQYYSYWCETDCWQIEYSSSIEVFSDVFSNGRTTTALPIADILLNRKTKILVEIQQFSLTPKAYDYYKTIKDLIDNNGSFNAPLPATLIGNIYNPNDSNEYVLGRFTASSAITKSIMIDRTNVEESALEPRFVPRPEPPVTSPTATQVLYSPCEEGRYRTAIEPEGWID